MEKSTIADTSRNNTLLIAAMATLFICLSPFLQDIGDIPSGLLRITAASSQLLSDYFHIGGPGAALINSAIILLMELLVIHQTGAMLTGTLMAGLFTTAGFAFFGTNPLNSLPIITGVALYACASGIPCKDLLMQAFLATAIAPIVSFIPFGTGLPLLPGLLLGIIAGVLIGFVFPILSSRFLTFHQGYSLYNSGFTAGILAMVVVSVLRLFHVQVTNIKLLYNGHTAELTLLMAVLFILLIGVGLFRMNLRVKGYVRLLQSTGRLPSDYVTQFGEGIAIFNMGVMGLIGLVYVRLMGGPVNGPVMGGLMTLCGFGAFGNHPRNSIPILIGVTLVQVLSPADAHSTGGMLSALFGTTLAPIAGAFGAPAGILAGVIHAAVAANLLQGHGGINLYNNGFAGGFVAGVLVPLLESRHELQQQRRSHGK